MSPGVPHSSNESRLTIGPKTMKDLLEHFPVSRGARSDPQLVWTFNDDQVSLRSMESAVDSRGRGQLSTEISITTEEFDTYDLYEEPTTISFHLREFTATIAFADSMSFPMEVRFTEPAAPLFIDVEGDMLEALFVISTSNVPAGVTTAQHHSQRYNARKRERAQSTSETPRFKRPMKAAQPIGPGNDYNKSSSSSRENSHMDGSMPPPSIIPNRGSYNLQPHSTSRTAGSSSVYDKLREVKKEPLFLPSSQMSEANLDVLQSTGLGLENMDAEELTELLEGEGEEVDFSHISQQPPGESQHAGGIGEGGFDHSMQVDQDDSFELEGLPATQERENAHKTFQPLFDD
ncbi:hypothetical protein JR316_0002372 [Psilocybe cubensis]|nr:hypothetical protein JR316_0002372 [Psilocybe cubensis]KAH9485464.1 hypothetical protein JR316_0002372 [Psilocybe cubensis]